MNNIKKFSKMLNMSKEEFGKRIGLSRATVGRIESEEARPTERTIVTICSVFHIRRDYLLDGKEPIWEKSQGGYGVTESLLIRLQQKHHLTTSDIRLIQAFIDLSPQDRISIVKFMEMFSEKK